jgi:hypothetical protein
MNDIVEYERRYFSTDAYASDLKHGFDMAAFRVVRAPSNDVGERSRSHRGTPVSSLVFME